MEPRVPLPPGAARWETPNDVAIRFQKTVRVVRDWYVRGLVHGFDVAACYGGIWLAVTAAGVPLPGPKVEEYRQQRAKAARKGALLGAAASVAARKAKRAQRSRSTSRAAR